jgi:hypothetical protein
LLVAATLQTGVVAYGRGDLDLAVVHYEDALRRARAAALTEFVAAILGWRGLVEGDRGNLARAAATHREALALHAALGDRRGMAHALANLAVLAAGEQPEPAARLLGAADGLRERVGLPSVDRTNGTAYGRAHSAARAALGEAAFAAAWTAGRALTPLEALALATAVAGVGS